MHLIVFVETSALGGSEIATGYLLEALRPDIQVTAMGPDAGMVEWLASRRPGSRAIVVPPLRSKWELAAWPHYRRVLRSLSPAVFQAVLTFQTACQWPLLAAAGVPGVATVAVEHLVPLPPSWRGRSAKRRTTRRLDAHIAVGDSVARAVESAFHLDPGSVRTIYNGVPDRTLTPKDLGNRSVVGAIGRFHPMKGFDVLIRAMALVPGADLVLVGGGDEEGRLRALAAHLGIEARVHFVGWSEEPRNYLGAFDVVAVPSREEATGLVTLEAMLARRPVVASRVGSVPELVEHNRTGVLVPPGDDAALAGALRDLLADALRRSKMGDAGRERALTKFSVEAMAAAYEAVYDAVSAR